MRTISGPDQLRSIAAELRSGASDGRSPDAIRDLFRSLCKAYQFPGITRSHQHVWYRARICEDASGYSSIYQMLYPPEGSRSFGRASLPGTRVLYAGWNQQVALEEVGASRGHVAQLISLRVQSPVQFRCAVIGEYQAIFNSGRSVVNSQNLEGSLSEELVADIDGAMSKVFVDSVTAEIFRSNISCSNDYVTSAVIADSIVGHHAGLMYPSIRTSHAINLAVHADDFDRNFEVLESTVYEVLDYHGYGLFSLKPLKATCEITSAGQFVWNSKRQMPSTLGSRRDKQVPSDFIGWRVR